MRFSIRETVWPLKREVALASLVVLTHGLVVALALRSPDMFSGKPLGVSSTLPPPISVTLHTAPSNVAAPAAHPTDKPQTNATKHQPLRPKPAPNAHAISTQSSEKTSPASAQHNFLPPSAFLQYKVRATRNGDTQDGRAHLFWQTSRRAFSVQGEITLAEKNALTFNSEGVVDAQGLSPTIYSEKRGSELPTNTLFQWDKKKADFSTQTPTHSLGGGEQDRASIIWQLSGMGQKNSHLFAPNAQFYITVLGSHEGMTWSIHVLSQETLATPLGDTRTWHVSLTPANSSQNDATNIWFAPELNWYPVKLRFTEQNGNTLELDVQELTLTTES